MKRQVREFSEEAELHLSERAAELERGGMDPAAARRQARIEFGNLDNYTEQAREAAGGAWLRALGRDLAFGLRLLRKSPGFTLSAVLLLAIGIGANAAIFSMVDWLLLRPIPAVQMPGELVYVVADRTDGRHSNGFSYPNFDDIRRESGAVFSGVAAVIPFEMDGLTADGETIPFWPAHVSGNYFALAGVQPALGRFFASDAAGEAAAPAELVLSYDYWRKHFGGRTDVLGERVTVNGRATTIVGVAPRGFVGLTPMLTFEGYVPFSPDTAGELGSSTGDFFHDRTASTGLMILARRRPGVSVAAAQPVLRVIARRLAGEYPKAAPWRSLTAIQLTSAPPGASMGEGNPLETVAGLFLGLAGMVLLLACVNIANLLLARAGGRRRELALRAALGAGRGRLLRQMLAESLLLSALGCAGGLLVALAACRVLNAIPLGTSIPVVFHFGLSARVFAYACGLGTLTGLAIGVAPAWQASRVAPQAVLQAGGRPTTARTHWRAALVAGEIAGSLALLIIAGLFTRSLLRAEHTNLGFQPDGVVNLSFDPHAAGDNAGRGAGFAQAWLEKVQALPGVEAASVAATVPMGEVSYGGAVTVAGRPRASHQDDSAGYNAVTPDYFRTMGIRLLRGRSWRRGEAGAAVINEVMARKYWPEGDALGRAFTMDTEGASGVYHVVGVAENTISGWPADVNAPFVYLDFGQHYLSPATLQVRIHGISASAAMQAAREQARELDAQVPVFDAQTMTAAMQGIDGYFLFELGAMLAASLGLAGLFMAVVGVYGVVAYSASQRTHEFGVRLALGAGRGQILRLMLRQGAVMTAVGLAIGVVLAAVIGQAAKGMLFGVGGLDPWAFGGATLLLAAVAVLASLVPARRAMAGDPVRALRWE